MIKLPNLWWRSELLTKRWSSPPVQCNQKAQTFLCLVIPHNRNNYVNSGKDVYNMEALCRMSVQDQSARSCFTHWLQDRSNRLVVLDETMVRLYQIYLGTQVQLHFWRKILEIGEYVTTIDENHSETKKKQHGGIRQQSLVVFHVLNT